MGIEEASGEESQEGRKKVQEGASGGGGLEGHKGSCHPAAQERGCSRLRKRFGKPKSTTGAEGGVRMGSGAVELLELPTGLGSETGD